MPGTTRVAVFVFFALLALAAALPAAAQEVRIRDLTITEQDIPYRLMGYGLVVGLDGTGDRVIGGFSSGHTVRSIANLLRNFGVEVPENVLRTRNVAAVLVTAEASPYLRPGGRFDVSVASVGDATSLRGGQLYLTPLQWDINAPPVGTAQGPVLLSDASMGFGGTVETSATMPEAGILEQPLPRTEFNSSNRLLLRHPDLQTALQIAASVNGALGDGVASVEDPGSVVIQLPDGQNRVAAFAQIGELTASRSRSAQVVIDSRSGTVVAGGNVQVGEAVVSHGGLTLSVGEQAQDGMIPGDLRVQPGSSVQDVAAALHAVAAPPETVAAVFTSLQQVGAITARVSVR
jgi:flagellar P-ring protein precursor FlgI